MVTILIRSIWYCHHEIFFFQTHTQDILTGDKLLKKVIYVKITFYYNTQYYFSQD